jgi:hypothetical protein
VTPAARQAITTAAALLAVAAVPPARAYDDWARDFRLGAWAGFGVSADFSLAGSVPVAGAIGPTGVPGRDHTYDDGFVRVDGTGNAGGLTSAWGYNDASQAVGDTLLFRGTTAFSATDASRRDAGPQWGLDMAYGGTLARWGRARIGADFGFGLLPVDIRDSRTINGTARRSVHAFETGGIVLPAPGYVGPSSGIGPLIRDVASPRPDETMATTIRGTRSIDAWVYNLRLGPRAYFEIARDWALAGSAGFAAGIVVGDHFFDETVSAGPSSSARNTGRIGKTEAAYGGYADLTLYYHVSDEADLYVGARWMTMGDVRFEDANRSARLRMDNGVQLLLGIRWPF